jgi:hypothetical protein
LHKKEREVSKRESERQKVKDAKAKQSREASGHNAKVAPQTKTRNRRARAIRQNRALGGSVSAARREAAAAAG